MGEETEKEGHSLSLSSPKLGADDENYVSRLSTILVASIQDVKDRISQIEFIFCSQLYPNFQSRSKTLHGFYSDATKSLQNQWKQRESELLLKIEEMRLENRRILEENRLLKDEKAKDLVAKEREIEELQRELGKKGEEVDEGMELQKSLVELVQSKGSLAVERDRQLKESEEKRKGFLARVNELEEEVENLRDELRRKNEQMADEIQLREKLHTNNLELKSAIENSEKERKGLLAQVDDLEVEAEGIRRKLRMRTQEVEQGEELHKQLSQQMELKSLELLESKKKLDVYEKENKLLLDKVKCLEEKINEAHKVRGATGESSNGMDSYPKLLKQVESVTSELQAERKKRIHMTDAYKRLKSQHNYLRGKVGLTTENMLHQNKSDNESDLSKHRSPITAPGLTCENPNTPMDAGKTAEAKSAIPEDGFGGLESSTPDAFVVVCDTNKVKEEALEDDKGANLSPSSSFLGGPKCSSNTKSVSVSSVKRSASSWRQTRSHQSRGGLDPHDDFLDTPLENIRENLNKDLKKDDIPDPIQKDIRMDSSDEETQDLNAKSSPQKKQSSIPVANKRSFKYIEPVRKKAERENLKGVECKQCRKFYEAVLPNADGKDPDSSKNFRCEHHDGVSRHRYRYVPPMTPEGFWNIGFESEI